MNTTTAQSRANPAVRAYAARHGIAGSAFRSDGRMTLHVDGRYRVQLRPASDNRIALLAQLLELDEWPAAALEGVLLQLAAAGAGLMRDHAAGLVIDQAGNTLQLQQVLVAGVDVDQLEKELAGFINVLAFWTQACAQERARMRA